MIGLAFLILLLALSFSLSAAETAFSALTAAQVQKLRQQAGRGQWVAELLRLPEPLFASISFGNLVVNTTACVLAYVLAAKHIGEIALWVTLGVMAGLLYFLGEVLPKSFASQQAEAYALTTARWMKLWLKLTLPLLRIAEAVGSWACRSMLLSGWLKTPEKNAHPTADEYLDLIEEGERLGLVVKEERGMITRILSLGRIHASDIMTPRADMMTVDDRISREELLSALRQIKHRYIPMLSGATDEIVGIINARKLLLHPEIELDAVLQLPSFVPETMNVARLLQSFQKGHHEIAIVVDEYGSIAGLVTIEDIVEEIVGEIEDEFDVRELMVQQLSEHTWLVNGKARLDHLGELLGTNLSSAGADTLGGWMLAQLGAFPKEGDQLKHDILTITVRRVGKNRVREILVERAPAPPTPEEPPQAAPRKKRRKAKQESQPQPPAPPTGAGQFDLPFGKGGGA